MKVFFEFVGGPRDAELLEGCPHDANIVDFDVDAATAHYWETKYGELGTEFFVLSPYARKIPIMNVHGVRVPPEHEYRIVNRIDDSNETWIVAQYVAPVSHNDVPSEHKCPWYERLINLGIEEVTSVHTNFPEFPLRVV